METALKKRYGQHFLRDTGILRRIIEVIRPSGGDLFIEIGAGDGALSQPLAAAAGKLIAVEIDADHIPALEETLLPFPNAEVAQADFLGVDLTSFLAPRLAPELRLRIAGNLPYNIGTAIIEKLLSAPLPIHDMTFMLQYETAARIAAAPGSRDYGFFTVYCQHFCEVKLALKVPAACFVPRPRVLSAVITMHLLAKERDPRLEREFLAVTKAAFAYRRKKLSNALRRDSRLGPAVVELLRQAAIDGDRRAEDLTVTEYESLARLLAHENLVSNAG